MADEEQIILPERYKRVDFLESTGAEYINTGLIPNETYGFWAKVQSLGGTGYVAGTQNSSGQPGHWLRVANGIICGSYFTNGSIQCSTANEAYNQIIVENNFLNNRQLISNGNLVYTYSNTFTHTWKYNFTLFKATYTSNTNFDPCVPVRIFRWKMSIGTEIVQDFVPVYDTYKNEACFYEIIEGKAYYNQGSGAFSYSIPKENEQLGILHKLPEGFKKVNYLIANGSQYIDTNYIPTNETGYYVEGQGYTTSEGYFFGSAETTTWADNKRIYFCATPNVNWGWMTYGTLTNTAAYLRQETKVSHNFLNSRISKATINETDFTYNLPELNFTPTRNIYLFGINLADSINYNGLKGRIDTFLISEGDKIVRQFVPCLDADEIPCMYELYTGTIHYNQGTGQFSYPREYTDEAINLPANYTKCVYLQSDGTQWIDTTHIANDETGLYLRTQCLGNGNHVPFGSYESEKSYWAPRFNTSDKSANYVFGAGSSTNMFLYDKGDDLIYTSTLNLYSDRKITLISEDTRWEGIISNTASAASYSLWLFSWNTNKGTIDTTNGKFIGRIFRAKITQDDYLAHDFVPCLDENNRPCMYDLVTQTPYYNQSGGVEFTYCLEHQLPSDFIKLDYIESTGTQIIKTGIVPTNSTGIYVDAYHTKHNGDTDWSVIGLRDTNGNTYFTVGRVQRDTNGAGFGWGTFTTPGGTGNVRYEASLNFLNDRQSIITAPAFAQRINALGTLSFTPTKDLYMFGMNNYDGAETLYSTYRIYRAKISEGTEVVRDWVPAMDNHNSRPCMYDLINNVAYYNDGAGDFDYNKDFEGTYTGFSGLGGIGNKLSGNAYRLVNALITDGKCRINLGKGIIDSTISQDFRGYTTNKDYFMFGTSNVGVDYFWQGHGYVVWGGLQCAGFKNNSDMIVVVDVKNSKIRCNKSTYGLNGAQNFTSDKQTSIFDVGRKDTESSYIPAAAGSKFYKWVMKKDGVIIHDYRPAVDNNLIPCVLDTITGEAFYNTLSGVLSWE